MDEKPREVVRYRYRYRRFGCGGGFFLVLTVGIVMALFNLAISIGISVRVPLGNQNVFNNSTTMTIGPAEGTAMVVIGRQDGAPVFDLHLDVR